MPRLLDRLDAATGLVPEFLDADVDYLERRPPPPQLVDAEGHYNAGWYERFDGALNLDDSMALDGALQRWLHLTLNAPDHFIVLNLADMGKASNTAVLVVDKATGTFREASLTGLGPAGHVSVSDDARRFVDAHHASMARFHGEDDARLSFSMHAEGLHVTGVARRAIGPTFVQVTRYQRGRGSLQWYGNLELEAGILTLDDRVIPLPPGTLGTFDRTVGHQRGIQAWNWLAVAGQARCAETGRVVPIGIQVARDRPGARPRVESKKHAVWLEGELHKIPTAAFAYDIVDEGERTTSDWRLTSPSANSAAPEPAWLDLTFRPRFHRRELKRLLIAKTDFNQYYGEVEGRLRVQGRTWELLPTFAVTEESWLEL